MLKIQKDKAFIGIAIASAVTLSTATGLLSSYNNMKAPSTNNNINKSAEYKGERGDTTEEAYKLINDYLNEIYYGFNKLKMTAANHWNDEEYQNELKQYSEKYVDMAKLIYQGIELEGITRDELSDSYISNITYELINLNKIYYNIIHSQTGTYRTELQKDKPKISNYISRIEDEINTLNNIITDPTTYDDYKLLMSNDIKEVLSDYGDDISKLLDFIFMDKEFDGVNLDELSDLDKDNIIKELYKLQSIYWQTVYNPSPRIEYKDTQMIKK